MAILKHIACIMDGNRRWASARGLMPWQGHQEGFNAVERVISFALENGIAHVTLYAFSLENFKRPEDEKSYLFTLLVKKALEQFEQFKQRNIKLSFVGDRQRFPESVIDTVTRLEQETAQCTTLTIHILFCYGAQQEMVAAFNSIHQNQHRNAVDLATLRKALWSAEVPDIDLIIRTGGLRRMSNFLFFQSAYSELYFLDTLWPDITHGHLQDAVDYFAQCKRNFGR